jgi:hypothetical protein
MRPSKQDTSRKREKVKCPSVPNLWDTGTPGGTLSSRSVSSRIAMGIDAVPWRGTLGHFFYFLLKEQKRAGQREDGVESAARGNKEDSSVPVSLDRIKIFPDFRKIRTESDELLVEESAGQRRMKTRYGKDVRGDRQMNIQSRLSVVPKFRCF